MTRLWCRLFGHRPIRHITRAVMRSAGQYVIMESHHVCTRCGDRAPKDFTPTGKRARW